MSSQKQLINQVLIALTLQKPDDNNLKIDNKVPMTSKEIALNVFILFILCPLMIFVTLKITSKYEESLIVKKSMGGK